MRIRSYTTLIRLSGRKMELSPPEWGGEEDQGGKLAVKPENNGK